LDLGLALKATDELLRDLPQAADAKSRLLVL